MLGSGIIYAVVDDKEKVEKVATDAEVLIVSLREGEETNEAYIALVIFSLRLGVKEVERGCPAFRCLPCVMRIGIDGTWIFPVG